MKNIRFLIILSVFSLSGCASFSISKEHFVQQLKDNQELKRRHNIASVGTGYDSNSLEKIKCLDKNGNEVWLYGGKNVSFKISDLSGNSTTLYFDTVFFEQDTIFGLKSRILGGKRSIPVNAISKVTIEAEQAVTKPVQ